MNGLSYIHSKGLIHKDLKCSNILYNNGIIKICDFGSCDSLNTNLVECTLSYKSPELLMSLPYSNKIDIWGLGLIYIEILCDKILFDASSEFEMLDDIFDLFGTPTVYF